MIEKITPESEEHWLDLRSKDITSTESSALFALSPYTTELELFYRKQSGQTVHFEENDRMLIGRLLEPSIATIVAEKIKCSVTPFKDYVTDPDLRMGSSFDYLITDGEYSDWILEIKNVDHLVYKDKWQDDLPPAHIEIQVQHQLALTQKPGCVLAALVGGNDLRLIYMERNDKMGDAIKSRIDRFWRDVKINRAPEPDFRRDADFLLSFYTESGDSTHNAVDDLMLAEIIREYIECKEQIKSLTESMNEAKAQILHRSEGAKKLISKDYIVNCSTVKAQPPTQITQDMVGQFTGGRKEFRRFTIREKK